MSNRTVLVTGGAGYVGSHCCKAFAEAGASLVISSRKQGSCEDAAAAIRAETGAECLAIACHVGDWDACDALVEAAWGHFGRIDVLVNNAGMSPLYKSLSSITRELWDKVIAVNLGGPFRLSAVVAEKMVAGEGGSIINVSSTASIAPGAAEIPYAAAKAGVNNLTQSLAHSFAPKVRTNCIMPGPFLTDISDAWSDDVKKAIAAIVPLGRAGEAEEIIGAALFLASDAASYTNGAILKVDGGMAFQ